MTRCQNLLFALLALAGCSPSTELVVLVDSDYVVGDDIGAVIVSVRELTGPTLASDKFVLGGNDGLPFSFGIAPGPDYTASQVQLDVSPVQGLEEVLWTREVVVDFVTGELRLLPIFLARACHGMRCADDESCDETGCVSRTIDSDVLSEVEPGDELNVIFMTPSS